MAKVRIEVTAEDIAKGNPGDACACPVALALQRVLGDAQCSTDGLECYVGGQRELVNAPPSVREFVDRFDKQADVEPFAFEIEVPS